MKSILGPLHVRFFVFFLPASICWSTIFVAAQQKPAFPTAASAAVQRKSSVSKQQQSPLSLPPASTAAHALGAAGQKTLSIDQLGHLSYAPPWQVLESRFSNAYQLVRLMESQASPPSPNSQTQEQQTQSANGPLARLLITTEKRDSHADAIKRLQELAFSRAASVSFYAISGWPAVELQFTQKLPRRGAEQQGEPPSVPRQKRESQLQIHPRNELQLSRQEKEGAQGEFSRPTPIVERAIVAIAIESDLVTLDIMLAPETSKGVLQEALEIVKSFIANRQEQPDELRRSLRELQQAYDSKTKPQPPPKREKPPDLGTLEEEAGAAQIQSGGNGELEVSVSPNGRTIVIASNSSLTHSINSGAKFTGGSAPFGLNDPTLARGKSGAFYLGQIAFPNGTPAQKNQTGCTNAVSRSTNGGANFLLRGFSAVCPAGVNIPIFDSFCFPDQPHIAADSFTAGSADQVYAVWREINSINIFGLAGTTNCNQVTGGTITPAISCSQNSGATWTAPAALSGIDDFPRLAVGADGKVYVVGMSGDSVMLTRFTSCKNGLSADVGFPVTVANLSGQVNCPVPGLDRCNDGNVLSSPTVAPDPTRANHVSVSFAEQDGSGGERIVTMESHDSGATFPNSFTVSSPTNVRRFMPWSCMAAGQTFVGWYDRGPASGALDDLTDYLVGGTILASPKNLSNNPDRQCALWPCAPRSQNDSESCSVQPELAGVCQNGSGGGSQNKCDFDETQCPNGESCQTGGGCPKYGDYNGIACANQFVVAAWASATAPKGLPRNRSGISVFSQAFSVKKSGPPTFDRVQISITTGNDNADSNLELIATFSGQKRSICLKPSTSLSPDGICSNGNGAHDQNGQDTWNNFTGNVQGFTLDTPQASAAAFKTLTITSLQSSCGLSCSNWDLQAIRVVVSDSSKKLKAITLLNVANAVNSNNNDNCIARLRAPPNVNSVTYKLNAAKPTSTTSNFGPTPPGSCPQ